MTNRELPETARVVVIGGGVIGCSVAYHLGQMGCRDVVLLERDQLTSGTTWHAAGLMVRFGSLSEVSTELRKYTHDLYSRLEEETGLSTGFRPVGFVQVATDRDRLEEYRRVSALNRFQGVDVQEVSPSDVAGLFPLARTDDVLAGFYVEGDGRVDPVGVTQALAKGARMNGVTIVEGVRVTNVTTHRGAVTGVTTDQGEVRAEVVVNCSGMWARQLGDASGVTIPLQAAEHYYLITEKVPGLESSFPVLEDPSSHAYFREEVGGLMVGFFEPICAPWRVEGIPDDFSFGSLPPDWERMLPYIETAMRRVPSAAEIGVKKLFCGPESFTPDLRPIVGEAPELKNYFVAAGLNSVGILTGGGIGRVLAHWIVNGRPDVDVTGIHIDRLHPYQNTPAYRRARTVESLGMVYQCHYPTRSMETARGARLSPIHERLHKRGAYFRDVSGWEGADWYSADGSTPDPGPLTWGRPSWFSLWENEHRAIREGVGLMDMSFMAKFSVEGSGAGAFLSQLSAGDVNGPSGRITYTQWLNEGGTIEADLTVTKLAEDRFWVVASDTAHRHTHSWMLRHAPEHQVSIADMTSAYAQINIQGPRSRELLAAVTSADMSNAAFPFRHVQTIDIGLAEVLCARITYLGELGYELTIPAPQAAHVYDCLVEAGTRFGLRHVGLKALASLRLEKGYRDYGHDIDNLDSPLEAGLSFAVSFDKEGGFLGKEALLERKAKGAPKHRLIQVLLKDPTPMLYHGEIVYRDDVAVGVVRAGSYGFTLGGAVGLAMVEASAPIGKEFVDSGRWEVDIAGQRVSAIASLRPLYDPGMERVRS